MPWRVVKEIAQVIVGLIGAAIVATVISRGLAAPQPFLTGRNAWDVCQSIVWAVLPNAPINVEETKAFERCVDTVAAEVEVRGRIERQRVPKPAAPVSPVPFIVAPIVFLALLGAIGYLRWRWQQRKSS
jgi:hypothetical protein